MSLILTTGLFSLVLSLFTKQPVSINLSVAALIFIAGSASGFTLAQILGANLVVGVTAVALSLLRLNELFSRIIPPQIAIGVFAGTIMAFMWKTSIRAIEDPIFSAPVIGGFLVALLISRSHLVAVIAAAVVGLVGVVVTAGMPDTGGSMALPAMALPAFDFNPSSLIALGVPLLILTVGIGNVQALAILKSEGFQTRSNLFGLAAGAASLLIPWSQAQKTLDFFDRGSVGPWAGPFATIKEATDAMPDGSVLLTTDGRMAQAAFYHQPRESFHLTDFDVRVVYEPGDVFTPYTRDGVELPKYLLMPVRPLGTVR